MATTWAPVVDRPGAEPGTASLGSTGKLLHFCSLDSLFVAFSMARWDIGGQGKESQQPGDTKSCIERQRGP